MEVAIGANGSTPFQREVREWQRVDPNTGALMSGRLEADRWINGPLNAYGKVVDSQNVSKPNGTQHTQRKQLEVLQARTSSGSLQVVRAQTVQTSSSRWSSSSSSSGTRTTTQQSFEGQRFSNGLHLTNGHLLDGHDQHQYQNHQQQHQQHQQQLSNQLSSRLLATPSLKLSSLMKSSPAAVAATNGGGRISPHSPQLTGKHQHQKLENETRSSSSLTTSCRYQPTVGEVRVGVGGSTEQMESFRNEREIRDSSSSLEQSHHAHLPRGRSISTDDLSTEWDQNEDGDESSEWRRVSKIRRSFQFPKSTSPKPCTNRPSDLPENSVSVSRIREELENGRRLSTAMRNNHVDLAALSNILNGTTESETKAAKRTSFLTAESLKEIRGRLKKLSDESLYKDDFITQKEADRENDIMTESNSGLQVEKPVILQDAHVVQQPDFQYRPILDSKLATNSLENRLRYRDNASSEWHLRRKSYGFEKMTPQDHSIFRSEPSTDSGIGRSGELSNWSPTETTPRTTIIKFGENATPTVMSGHDSSSPKPVVQRRYNVSRSSEGEEVKRHSIAVDESKYVRDNLRKVFDTKTSIHLNGLYLKESNSSQVSIGEENGRKQKKVEFCKTEVHFAAESGRVNIVETDGKPPPTNNFRRRRRGSGGSLTSSYLDAMNSGMPVIHFGDEKKTLFEQETAVEEIQAMKNNVTVSLAITNGSLESSLGGKDDEDENADEISLRGILKNKPIKPKPYHLGENVDSKDNLWGVRLRPVASELISPKPKDDEKIEEPKVNLIPVEEPNPLKSVAERIRIVEERKDGSGYSTKINLNLSNSPYAWNPDSENHHPEPIKPLQLRIQEHTTQKVSSQTDDISEGLKSTSLIMKTIKSASQFDEAMKRLNQPDTTSGSLNCSATKLISNMNAITKSSSANSIFQEMHKSYRPNYSSSLDGDVVLSGDETASQKIISSSSFSSSSSSSFIFDKFDKYEKFGSNTTETVSKPMEPLREEPTSVTQETPRSPIAAPRIKVIGSSSAVSHQLSQLRRMYDATDFESDDSARADEEVKRYLGGGGTGGEFSGSWSRLKVQRSNNKKQLQNDGKAEVRKPNVMSIDLRSPTQTAKKTPQSPVAISTRSEAPVAHPRTVTTVKTTRSSHNETTERNVYKTESIRSPVPQKPTPIKDKEPLKVVTGGARKLREHELSYFGVKVNNNCDEKPRAAQRTITNPEANRKPAELEVTSKWNLPSDKPDLLRHSPDGSTNTSSRQDDEKSRPKDGPIYENLKKPSSYSRKKDLQRDEMILNEMTKTADQTLKAVGGNTTQKDHSRRTPQRSTRPLDTIQEVQPSHAKHHQRSMKSKGIQVSRVASEGFQRQCCSNRPSSASSTESLSRLSNSSSVGRSRSRSRDQKEKVEKIEYAAVKQTKKLSSPANEYSRIKTRRSTSHASSSEDLANVHHRGEPRKIKRTKPKEKESTVRSDVRTRSSTNRIGVESEDRNRSLSKSSGYEQIRRSHRSAKDEKVERVPSSRTKASSSASDYHQKTQTKSSSAVIASTRSSASSSSKRPSKDYSTRK